MSEKPYSSKYANSHRVMLESLTTKQLRRLYHLRDMARLIVSNRESRAKDKHPKSDANHDAVQHYGNGRRMADSQRWAIEEVLIRRANQEADALNPRPDPKVRIQNDLDEINAQLARLQETNEVIRLRPDLTGTEKLMLICDNTIKIGNLFIERDRLMRWLF